MRLTGSSAFFVIRAKPGQATALLRRVPEALKAASTRRDILVYFLTENGLISLAGAAVGIVLSFALNQWMLLAFETTRLPLLYVGAAAAIILCLGQLAVLSPAKRASRVPPVEATRSA